MMRTNSSALLVMPPGSAEGTVGALGLVEAVERDLPAGPGLLLLHDDRAEPAARARGDGRAREAALARSALGREEIVLRAVSGPVTRFLLAARVLASGDLPVGVLASAVDVVLDLVRTHALLAGVGGLEDPQPDLGQHARSLLPGGCFLVDRESVLAVKSRLPRGLGRGAEAELAVSGDKPSGDWADRLWSALGPTSDQPEPTVLAGRSCWGTTRWAEISVLDHGVAEVALDLGRLPTRTCSWCARPVLAARPCPFCGATVGRPVTDMPRSTKEHP